MQILIRVFGILGMAGAVSSFQCKTHKQILLLSTLSELAFALQYILLGSYTGAAMNLMGCVRKLVFAQRVAKGKDNRIAILLFCVFFVIAGILTWQGPVSLFITAAKCITTIAYGSKHPFVIRTLNLFSNFAWLIYDWYALSYEGALSDLISIVSILLGIVRLDLPVLRSKVR